MAFCSDIPGVPPCLPSHARNVRGVVYGESWQWFAARWDWQTKHKHGCQVRKPWCGCRRKLEEQAGKKPGKKGKGGSASSSGTTTASPSGSAPAVAASAPANWAKIPKTKAKKGKKGQKMDGSMLGFSSNVDYSVLERPET